MPSATPLAHLSANDRALFYKHGFGPVRPVSIPIIHHAFKKHAQEQPKAIAVEHLSYNEKITYAHLDTRSNQLAHTLRAREIVPGKRVCILARRSVALIVGILAVLKSGAQYVPLDALSITDETLQFVLEDSTPSVVLVMEEFAHRVTTVPTICLEHSIRHAELSNADTSDVEDMSSTTDGAYCIYTSGTTGMLFAFILSRASCSSTA
jgi:non-ribosomal peptide synthetase component F